LIKSISQHQQLRSLVVVQQLYDGTALTFAPHHVRLAKNALVSQLNAVGDHRVHGKKLAALFAAMVVSLNCSR